MDDQSINIIWNVLKYAAEGIMHLQHIQTCVKLILQEFVLVEKFARLLLVYIYPLK